VFISGYGFLNGGPLLRDLPTVLGPGVRSFDLHGRL